ncbi:MAG: hypothetical protein IPL16_18220 [Ignavibacteria bacterium]|nr:hypothetical protein [Ignavibacteria bacterium]
MKNILILSFLLILGNCSIFCQNNDFSKEQTVDSTENNQNNTSVKKSTEDELKKGLSGKYEGILEVSLGSEMYDHKKGTVYFDLTADPIIYIYSGVNANSNSNLYYYENKKILSRTDDDAYLLQNKSFQENTLQGWFEKIDNEWVYWQKFEGYDEEGLDIRKPDYLRKTANLESSKQDIDLYLSQEAIFKEYWDKFKQAMIQADMNSLDNLIVFPLKDETKLYDERKVINTASEFHKRINKYINEAQKNPDGYFDKGCIKVMEIEEDHNFDYIFYGDFFLLIDRINGEYKVVRLTVWGLDKIYFYILDLKF